MPYTETTKPYQIFEINGLEFKLYTDKKSVKKQGEKINQIAKLLENNDSEEVYIKCIKKAFDILLGYEAFNLIYHSAGKSIQEMDRILKIILRWCRENLNSS